MAVEVTEKWSGTVLTRTTDGWTARRAFQVSGTSSQLEAQNAIPVTVGSSHPDNAFLRCNSVEADDNQVLRTVTCEYSTAPFAIFDPDPLNQPTQWRWQPGTETSPIDRDIYGNTIRNSAGVTFDPPVNRFTGTLHLQAVRNEPFYDVQKALLYQNKLNSDTFSITGAGIVQPGQVLCLSIDCASSISSDAPFVTVVYNFELRGPDFDGEDSDAGFKARILDQGDKCWYKPGEVLAGLPTMGNIVNVRGELVGSVPLDGTGKPINTNLKVGEDDKLSPETSARPLPSEAQVVTVGSGDTRSVYLYYTIYRSIAFSGLNL